MIHTIKGFSVVNEAEVGIFLELSCFSYDSVDVENLISGSSTFSRFKLCICKVLVHIQLKSSLKILSITLLACKMIAIVW